MITPSIESQLERLRLSQRIPGVILITGLVAGEAQEFLQKSAETLAGSGQVSPERGNLVVLRSEGENLEAPIKIDQVRALIKEISLQNWDPSSYRFILVPQAQNLTIPSSNALLKSLEEVPSKICYLLASPSKRNILPTIISRSFLIRAQGLHNTKAPNDLKDNAFYKAFFLESFLDLEKLSRSESKRLWQDFYYGLKEKFVEKVYSGDLKTQAWYELLDYVEGLNEDLDAHRDLKWVSSSIERFVSEREF